MGRILMSTQDGIAGVEINHTCAHDGVRVYSLRS